MLAIPASRVRVAVAAAVLAATPVLAEVEQVKTVPVRDLLARVSDRVPADADPVRLRLTFSDVDGRRLEDVTVTVRDGKDGTERSVEPAGPGTFEIDVTRRMVRRDASVVFAVERYRGLVRTDVAPADALPATAPEAAALSVAGMARLADASGELAVYHAGEEDADRAADVLALLEGARTRIAERIGSASACAVAIVRGDTAVRTSERGVWAWTPDREPEARFVADLLRDWIGRSVSDRAFLRGDSRNRWIAEGLAEWATVEVLVDLGRGESAAREVERGIAEGVDPLRSRSPATWDLNDFQWNRARGFVIGDASPATSESASGTALALAFWLKLVRHHGDDLPARFLDAAAALRDSQRKNRRLVETLGELTGHDYRLETQSFSIPEARAHLEAFVGRARAES